MRSPDRPTFYVTIQGRVGDRGLPASPDTVGVGQLLRLLEPLEQALQATAEEQGIGTVDAAVLTLREHQPGSSRALLSVPDYLLGAAQQVSMALAAQNTTVLPLAAQRALYGLSEQLSRSDLIWRLEPNGTARLVEAEISRRRPVAAPSVAAPFITGEATYKGWCYSINLDKLDARLKTLQGRRLTVHGSKQLLRQLTPYLADETPLWVSGEAEWDPNTYAVRSFHLQASGPASIPTPRDWAAALRQTVGSAFDDVDDPVALVRLWRDAQHAPDARQDPRDDVEAGSASP